MVMYDNESLSDALLEAIPVFLKHKYFNTLVVYKKETQEDGKKHYTIAPRIFRKDIKLGDSLLPINDSKEFEKILDGFINGDI